MQASLDCMASILAEECTRAQFTRQQLGKSMGHVEHYHVPHLVARSQEVRRPRDYELQCIRCRKNGQRSIDNVVLEHVGGEYAPFPATRERILTSGEQVLGDSTAHGMDIMKALEGILG
jgi:hypothetical protein